MSESFRWNDGDRTIRFGRGALGDAPGLLGEGYVLLTTPRAMTAAPAIADAARERHDVPAGRVDEVAAALLERLDGTADALLVALGGGRVIDVAKALCAAGAGPAVAAVPTTLSAAEMTGTYRPATGVRFRKVRPAIVLNDPALSASQPAEGLAASAANAFAHAVEGPLTVLASPVPTLAAHEAARLIAGAWVDGEPDRDALALGALLSGYAIDAMGYGLHHIASQTLVREGGVGHGPANAVLLPHTIEALRRRSPERVAALDRAVGTDVSAVAADLARRAGAERIRDLGVPADRLDAIADAAAARADGLALTPPAADAAELRELYASAW
jgi:alcohol dehydrogenase class IV